METLQNFLTRSNNGDYVQPVEVAEICSLLNNIGAGSLPKETLIETIEYLSYRSLDENIGAEVIMPCLEMLIGHGQDDVVDELISRLIPKLPRIKRNDDPQGLSAGLNPHFGISLREDEERERWRAEGFTSSISFFYAVLVHLKHKRVSSNLWWITPGILNIMDDSTNLRGIRLQGVLLLKTFLEKCFEHEGRWVSFHDTGLYALYEPTLLNMCYCLPPSFASDDSLAIWKIVFPTLNTMYRLQFKNDSVAYKHHLGGFLSRFLLQNVIPRINITNESLTEFALETVTTIVKILGVATVSHLQRIVYTLGEYLVRNAFFTLFTSLLDRTIDVFAAVVEFSPRERVQAHKYDFLAITLITYDKCHKEGKLNSSIVSRLRNLLNLLESKGCDLTVDKIEILKTRDMHQILA